LADSTITIKGDRHVLTQCQTCSVWHTVPQIIYESLRRLGGYYYCPSGHQWGWRTGTEKAENEAVRRERDRLKQDAARLEDELADARAKIATAEKKYLQARRRAVAGVCPCCNRSFENVQRHMKTKHPNVVPLAQKAAP
jgi:hypothetical protein